MHGCRTASDQWQSSGEHQPRSEGETGTGRGRVGAMQQPYPDGEQSTLSQQAPGAIRLFAIAEETEYLPQRSQREEEA